MIMFSQHYGGAICEFLNSYSFLGGIIKNNKINHYKLFQEGWWSPPCLSAGMIMPAKVGLS